MRRIHPTLPPVAAGLILLLAACSSAGTATSPPESASEAATESAAASEATAESPEASAAESEAAAEAESVMLMDFEYAPEELTIPAGTTVSFMNMDQAPHTATHGTDGAPETDADFDVELAAGNGTGEHTFEEAGTYNVTCTIHPDMNMVITVE
jgi:plastocyanin